MSIEGTANTEYASLSGKIRTFVIDKSLTISGACADAKATGDAIDKLIDNAEATAEKVASDTTNKKLVDFLDSTLTKSDKAAQAAAVGELDTALRGLIGERAQIVHGSYTGTGTKAVSITVGFRPKFVLVMKNAAKFDTPDNEEFQFFVDGISTVKVGSVGSSDDEFIEFNDTGISWTGENGADQYARDVLNESGVTYHYVAMG